MLNWIYFFTIFPKNNPTFKASNEIREPRYCPYDRKFLVDCSRFMHLATQRAEEQKSYQGCDFLFFDSQSDSDHLIFDPFLSALKENVIYKMTSSTPSGTQHLFDAFKSHLKSEWSQGSDKKPARHFAILFSRHLNCLKLVELGTIWHLFL